jgi:hypothetical protein
MKVSELVKDLIDVWREKGDVNVHVDLLTENQSNKVDIVGYAFSEKYGFSVDCDIEDIKTFKKNLK